MKTVTLKHVGYKIEGNAQIELWGGGYGGITMDSNTIKGNVTKTKILGCINDGQFGCVSIEEAKVDIYDLYENGYTEYNRTITIKGTSARQKYFYNGIKTRIT